MSDTLPLALRPTRFADIIGQDSILRQIKAQVSSGRVNHCWLLSGESGVGKTTLARILAVSFCGGLLKTFGSPKESLWKSYHAGDFDIQEENAANVNGVDDARQFASDSKFLPTGDGKARVFILDEAQGLTTQAQKALLKPFEDCPETSYWILCTTDPGKIIPTLKKRCQRYELDGLDKGDTLALINRGLEFLKSNKKSTPLLSKLQMSGIYAPRDILSAVERYGNGAKSQEAVFGVETDIETIELCRAFVNGNAQPWMPFLEHAKGDEVRMVRLALLGYLRKVLLNARSDEQLEKVSGQILSLAVPVPPEEPALKAYFAAVVLSVIKS